MTRAQLAAIAHQLAAIAHGHPDHGPSQPASTSTTPAHLSRTSVACRRFASHGMTMRRCARQFMHWTLCCTPCIARFASSLCVCHPTAPAHSVPWLCHLGVLDLDGRRDPSERQDDRDEDGDARACNEARRDEGLLLDEFWIVLVPDPCDEPTDSHLE